MTPNEKFVLLTVVAQLRHAYSHLMRESLDGWDDARRKEFAKGLIAPQIQKIENLIEGESK